MSLLRKCLARALPAPKLLRAWEEEELSEFTPAEIGLLGEDLAAVYLRREGMKVLFRNFRALHGGEADVVCRHGDALVFVEVKTRRSEEFGRPSSAVDKEKQRLILRGASAWLRMLDETPPVVRFDIVEVLLVPGKRVSLERIEDAFQSSKDLYL